MLRSPLAAPIGEKDNLEHAPKAYDLPVEDWVSNALTVVVVGASGDLAKKKIYPALFALYVDGHLPEHFSVFGYARSKMTDAEFREMIGARLGCRLADGVEAGRRREEFLSRCFYQPGQYDSKEDFGKLDERMAEAESRQSGADRIFYLSIPPNIFTAVAAAASEAASSRRGWTRMIVEKPFGRDLESSKELAASLYEHLTEDQIYRIDHYLGKELIENLTVLRFANLVFEPLWNARHVRDVQVIFSEDFGTEGRGGYFDRYGIVRDVVQNHLLQILALFAMEQPASLSAEDIRDEKVKVLRAMRQVKLEDVVVGQYRGRTVPAAQIEAEEEVEEVAADGTRTTTTIKRKTDKPARTLPGYLDDDTVPKGSLTPTFAAVAVFVDNARWDGVPFLLKAGKALHRRAAEIRVRFRDAPGSLYAGRARLAGNELVLRIQPDEAVYLKINNKVPGLGLNVDQTILDLTYRARYDAQLPDAYERLILDCINGDRRLFIRNDELEVAWEKFTPVLYELEEKRIEPELYPYGSKGPIGAHYLASKYGTRWGDHDE